jgi:hypothetical protein
VETITSSNSPMLNALLMEYEMIGLPQNGLMFFRGMRDDFLVKAG